MVGIHPLARVDGLTVASDSSDLLVHHAERNEFHTLNSTSAAVWRACDGTRTAQQISEATGLDSAIVGFALDELDDRGLLSISAPASGLTRREVVRRLAAAGIAGGVVLPVISSITGQSALAAGSDCFDDVQCPGQFCVDSVCAPCRPTGGACTNTGDCCTDECINDICTSVC